MGPFVPVRTGVNFAGVSLQKLLPPLGTVADSGKWKDFLEQVIESAFEVRKLKDFTSCAIGLLTTDVTGSIMMNLRRVHQISVRI